MNKYYAIVRDRSTGEIRNLVDMEYKSKKAFKSDISGNGYDLMGSFIYNEEQWEALGNGEQWIINMVQDRKEKKKIKNNSRRSVKAWMARLEKQERESLFGKEDNKGKLKDLRSNLLDVFNKYGLGDTKIQVRNKTLRVGDTKIKGLIKPHATISIIGMGSFEIVQGEHNECLEVHFCGGILDELHNLGF